MLDQNTDRMWYVIGAVIIGAAIILILNNTFPQLFASVGETFKGKMEQTTEVVDGIMPKGKNLLLNTDNDKPVVLGNKGAKESIYDMDVENAADGTTTYTILRKSTSVESYYRIMTDYVTNRYVLESGTYTLSGYIYIPAATTSSISIRSQYAKVVSGSTHVWSDDYGNGVTTFDAIERDKWVFFSETSILPEEATGYYVSFSSRDQESTRVAGDVFYTKGLHYSYKK